MVQKTFSIRRAIASDIPSLVELLSELFALESDFAPDPSRQRRGLETLLDHPAAQIFVADAEGKVIGMCTAQVLISTAEGGRVALVEDVVVRDDWRGQGVGAALLTSLEIWAGAEGLTRLQLLADMDNGPAHRFYENRGWSETRLRAWRKRA